MKVSLNFKRYMLADEDFLIYSLDLAGAEAVVVAYTSPEPSMIKCFQNKVDIHKYTAAMVKSIVTGKLVKVEDITPKERQEIKPKVHGLNYYMSYKETALQAGISETEAKEVYDAYHQGFPGIQQGWAWQLEKLRKDKTLESCWLKTRGVPEEWCSPRKRTFRAPLLMADGKPNKDLLKEASSFIPQNTVAEGVNLRGILFVYYNQEDNGFRTKNFGYVSFKHVSLLNQVHDSLVFQIPLSAGFEYHAAAVNAIKESLEQPIIWKETEFSIPVDIEVGLNLKDMIKFKTTVTAKQLKESYGSLTR